VGSDVEFAVVTQGARTTTGTQDYTVSGFGTPTAVIFFASHVYQFGLDDHWVRCFGAAMSAAQRWAVCEDREHGTSKTDTKTRSVTDKCLIIPDPSNSQHNTQAEADFNQWVTDGVQVDWTKVSGNAHIVTAILIRCDGALVGYSNVTGTPPSIPHSFGTNVNGHMVFAVGTGAFTIPGANDDGRLSVGWASQQHGDFCMVHAEEDAVNDGDPVSYVSNNRLVKGIEVDGSAVMDSVAIGSWLTNSCTLERQEDGSSRTTVGCAWLALDLGDRLFDMGIVTGPAATGDWTVALDPAISPHFLLLGMNRCTADNTIYNNALAGVVGVFCMTSSGIDNQHATDEYNSATTDTNTYRSNPSTSLALNLDTGGTGKISSDEQLDRQGWTITMSSCDSDGGRWPYFAVAKKGESLLPPLHRTQRALLVR
jgi:hypothetical protein